MRVRFMATPLLAGVLLVGAPLGCASLPVITQIASVVLDALAMLEIIDSSVDEWLARHPVQAEQVRPRYAAAYQKAVAALNLAQRVLSSAESLDQEQYDAAIKDFGQAYRELVQLLEAEGITRDGYLEGASGQLPVYVPPDPLALTYRVR